MKNIYLLSLIFIFFLFEFNLFAQDQCCLRRVGLGYKSKSFEAFNPSEVHGILSSFEMGLKQEGTITCVPPVRVDFMNIEANMTLNNLVSNIIKLEDNEGLYPSSIENAHLDFAYFFYPELTVKDQKFDTLNKIMMGEWQLTMSLMDPHHKESARSRVTSWVVKDDGGNSTAERINAMHALGKEFSPIHKTIYDYERIPNTLNITLEKEEISAGGEKMEITLEDIFHEGNTPPKEWQLLMLTLKHGQLLNIPKHPSEPNTWMLKVDGQEKIVLEYQSPEGCKVREEKLLIYNSCKFRSDDIPDLNKKIAESTFQIVCYELDIECKVLGKDVLVTYKGTIPLRLKRENKVKGMGVIDYATVLQADNVLVNITGTEEWIIEGELIKNKENGIDTLRHSGKKHSVNYVISGQVGPCAIKGTLIMTSDGTANENVTACGVPFRISAMVSDADIFHKKVDILWKNEATKEIIDQAGETSVQTKLTLHLQ